MYTSGAPQSNEENAQFKQLSKETTKLLHHESIQGIKEMDDVERQYILWNFMLMSILFSACHATVVSCLELAYARLGDLGAWQSGSLYLTYTGSAVFGATYVVKHLGARNAIISGMSIYCIYIGCFLVATMYPNFRVVSAITGASIGGIGAGFLWTAQGSYFAQSAEQYTILSQMTSQDVTSLFGGLFAFTYLIEEVTLKLLSSVMIELGYTWKNVYAFYLIVAILSCVGMSFVKNFNEKPNNKDKLIEYSTMYEISAAWRLFVYDAKMRYMTGLSTVFAISAAFLTAYVSSTVEPIALSDYKSIYVGILFSITSLVAAVMSMVFAFLAQKVGKGIVITIGAMSFFMVGFLFVLHPNVKEEWGWRLLILLFTLQGIGRATFESTLRASFADMFPLDKEGAFANIILQNGFASTVIFFMSSFISPFTFELLIMIAGVGAIWGYWKALAIYKKEHNYNGFLV